MRQPIVSGTVAGFVTIPELHRQTGIPAPTIRWHCRHQNGQMFGRVSFTLSAWLIPVDVAQDFVTRYRDRETQ